jgi:hypothetical protein
MLLPMNRLVRSSYLVDPFMALWAYAFVLEFFACNFFFMLCNLFIYVETIRIILSIVPVSLSWIDFRRRITGEVSMCCFDQIKALLCFAKHMLGC